MWIVGVNELYYPYIEKFENYKDAKEFYDGTIKDKSESKTVYLAEVKEFAEVEE